MRLAVNNEAEWTWKRPAPDWWGKGLSAAPKKATSLSTQILR